MKRLIFLSVIVMALLFLFSCEQINDAANQTAEQTISGSGCTAHSECIDENYQRDQLENCTWQRPEKCERGCLNGTCIPAPVCTVGFQCIDESRRGYQKEDCSFATKTDCEWGCVNGKCNERPANATNTTNTSAATTAPSSGYSAIAENAEENETEPEGPRYILQLGEEKEIEVDGTTHILEIYNLEVDRVIIKIDDIKSDWITEGGSFTYANIGTTVTVKSILFQAYGKREIEYVLS